LLEEQERDEKKKAKSKTSTVKTQHIKKEKTSRLSFKDKQEFEELEKLIPQLENEKKDFENQLASGKLGTEDIIQVSQRLSEVNGLIDEKTMRWLELSEI